MTLQSSECYSQTPTGKENKYNPRDYSSPGKLLLGLDDDDAFGEGKGVVWRTISFQFVHLFKVPRPGDSEVTFSVFEPSCTYYQSNHLKGRGNTV